LIGNGWLEYPLFGLNRHNPNQIDVRIMAKLIYDSKMVQKSAFQVDLRFEESQGFVRLSRLIYP